MVSISQTHPNKQSAEEKERPLFSITFDDGRRIQYEEYFPILEKFDLPATFYIVTSWINKTGFLGHDQIRDLWQRKNEIGSHTHTHVSLPNLASQNLRFELEKSKELLEQFNCTTLSYPFGHYSLDVVNETKKYYSGARTFNWSLKNKGRFRYNSVSQLERYELVAFPIDYVYAQELEPLAYLPLPAFKRAIEKIVNTGIQESLWTIFVYHGSREDIGPISFAKRIGDKRLWSNPGRTVRRLSYTGRGRTIPRSLAGAKLFFRNSMRYLKSKKSQNAEEISGFRWLCEFLSSHEQIEVVRVDEVLARSSSQLENA